MMMNTDQLGGCLTPSQIKIKRIQIKLHLQVSSLNFVITHFICFGVNDTLQYHIQIHYIIVVERKSQHSCILQNYV